jgi:hypothetical protein
VKLTARTWHNLAGGLGLFLEFLTNVIRNEEIVSKSLICEKVLFMRTNGCVMVVLEL